MDAIDADGNVKAKLLYDNVAAINGLRGAAATIVAVYHWTAFARLEHPVFTFWLGALSRLSELAVALFFVLSGFLLTLSVRRLSTQYGTIQLIERFFIARVARIAPLLVVVVTTAILAIWTVRWALHIMGPWGSYTELSFAAWLQNIILLNTNLNPPGWTLIYEVGAYFVLPFFVLIFIRSGLERWGWTFATVTISWLVSEYWIAPRNGSAIGIMPMFLPGIVLAFLLPHLHKIPTMTYLLFGTTILAGLAASGVRYYDFALITSLGCSCVCASVITSNYHGRRALTCRPMLILGDMTYSIYLWHYLIFWCLYYLAGLMLAPQVGSIMFWSD